MQVVGVDWGRNFVPDRSDRVELQHPLNKLAQVAQHARTTVGIASLPQAVAVEMDSIAQFQRE
jgi:enamine deaminase RidA (YjgF/YER057c/UK114 family)